MSLLSRLFGGGGGGAKASEPKPEVYEGVSIFAEPMNEGASHRLGARLEKEINGEKKTHMLIRADTFGSREAAAEAAVTKAKMLIDQMGDRLFK